jgi:hypothetical protein
VLTLAVQLPSISPFPTTTPPNFIEPAVCTWTHIT